MTASDSPANPPDPATHPGGARQSPVDASDPAALSGGGQSPALMVSAFLLELAAFGALGYAGWQLGTGIAQLFLVFVVPVAAIVVWGLFVAPKARVRLPEPARMAVELVVYAAAVAGLILAGAVVAGIVFGVLVAAFQLTRAITTRRTPAAT